MKTELTGMEGKLIEAVSAEKLMNFTKQVSKEVRLSGSEEELRAFQYAKQVLDSCGLETNLSFHDGFISLPIHAELHVDGESFTCITHSMATSTGEEGVGGELVFIDLEADESLLNVENRLALLEGIATPGAVEILENAGAIGAIFINGPITHEMIVSRVWGNPTPETKKILPKLPVVSVTTKEGDVLKQKLNESERPVSVWMKTEVDTGWRKIPTLIADLKGEVEPEKFVLFSGHIDSWHYGAMDNGGANATMLEVARVLTENDIKLRRSLRLAFWSGHSHGRYAGSTYYCDNNWEDLYENCVLHVYADSLGGKGATILGESNCMVETKDFGGEFVEKLTGEAFTGKRFGRGGDQSLWGNGIPALFMGLSEQPKGDDLASRTLVKLFGGNKSGGFGWWWHTTEDTIDKLDPENLKRDCQIYTAVISDACTRQIIPVNQAAAARELKAALEAYQEQAEGRIDLSLAIQRVIRLEQLGEELNNRIKLCNWTNDGVKRLNEALMNISRILIPLNYVNGDSYDHDLAMNQPAIPVLKDMPNLANATEGTDGYYEWKTVMKRRLNRVEHTLKKAIQEAESILTAI
ncbi:M28 family peptidase [Pseudalkalibacillus caeni]|uniref:M28 family peptidase n=1 Tax=Exobacillus caeni TaxID=2574798 RepID=A0A5R9F0R1_9BACL|nr:M28 family peptidase [Pseudalkalibacillus caeni]TLS36269.1 M28 family peptidase [Pseudalkalibacillus caeni]